MTIKRILKRIKDFYEIFVIGDYYLQGSLDKSMDMFGGNWLGDWDKIQESRKSLVYER